MSNIGQFLSSIGGGSGGKLRYQEFTSSGTFTPSATLLANGGQCNLLLVGGGGGGGGGVSYAGFSGAGGCGGGGGVIIRPITVSAGVSVIIGAGGAGVAGINGSTTGNTGNNGGFSSFGTYVAGGGQGGIAAYSYGGVWPDRVGGGRSGTPQQYAGAPTVDNVTTTSQGGGGAGSPSVDTLGGAGIISWGAGGNNTGVTIIANSGQGGPGGTYSVSSGSGSTGYCLITWYE